MLKPFLALIFCAIASACGAMHQHECPNPPSHKARAVNSWQGSDALRRNKSTIVQTAQSMGMPDSTVALLLAVAMQETQDISSQQRDSSKDNTPSANWSAFNVNSAYLSAIGYDQTKWAALNDDANLSEAVRVFVAGLQMFGTQKCLAFHRGGETAANDLRSYGAQEYIAQMKETQEYLIAHRDTWSDSTRVGAYVPHV